MEGRRAGNPNHWTNQIAPPDLPEHVGKRDIPCYDYRGFTGFTAGERIHAKMPTIMRSAAVIAATAILACKAYALGRQVSFYVKKK